MAITPSSCTERTSRASAESCCGLQVRRNLHEQGHASRKALLQREPLLEQRAQDALQPIAGLQFAQALRVGRGDIDCHVVRMGVDLAQAGDVVILRILDGRIKVLADADAANSAVAAAREPGDQVIDSLVIEAHAVDQRIAARNSEHAGLRIARLRTRRHGAQLNVAESQSAERIQVVAVLVEAGRQPQGMRKLQSKAAHRERRRNWQCRPQRPHAFQSRQAQIMRELGIEARSSGSAARAMAPARRGSNVFPRRQSAQIKAGLRDQLRQHPALSPEAPILLYLRKAMKPRPTTMAAANPMRPGMPKQRRGRESDQQRKTQAPRGQFSAPTFRAASP